MPEILSCSGLVAGYGNAVVLHGVSFGLEHGASLALLGRNGAGKTTLIDTLVGCTDRRAGSIRFASREIAALAPERRAACGLGWVPQERNVFRSLTVAENIAAVARPGQWTQERIFGLFPRLAERRATLAGHLSGGEQQMLAIGRALALNPTLLLLDEPLEGLAPIIAQELLDTLRWLVRDGGLSMILVEQKARRILEIADRALILDRGRVVYEGAGRDLLADAGTMETHLGVADRQRRPSDQR